MLKKEEILQILQHYNTKNNASGFSIVSLFGSYARDENDIFSDIDLTYKINHEKFYKDDAFAKIAKIDDIKKELQKRLHKKVDLIPANTKNRLIKKNIKDEEIFI